jgi:hypothetical protein
MVSTVAKEPFDRVNVLGIIHMLLLFFAWLNS